MVQGLAFSVSRSNNVNTLARLNISLTRVKKLNQIYLQSKVVKNVIVKIRVISGLSESCWIILLKFTR